MTVIQRLSSFYNAMQRDIQQRVSHGRKLTLDLIYPPQCYQCSAPILEHGNLCHNCWETLNPISSSHCESCGIPFDYSASQGTICPECLAHPPSFYKARAAYVYDGAISSLISRFKYSDTTYLAEFFAKKMILSGRDILNNADLLVPVPLHKKRLWHRRYNQSSLLAHHIGKLTTLEIAHHLLIRTKNTKAQTRLTKKQRLQNVKGAFLINKTYDKTYLQNKHVVLIDDVYTTGSTVKYCTKTLLDAGAAKVSILTIARALSS